MPKHQWTQTVKVLAMYIGCSCTKVDTKVGTSIPTTLGFLKTPASAGTTVDKGRWLFHQALREGGEEVTSIEPKIETILNVAKLGERTHVGLRGVTSDGEMEVGLMRTDTTRRVVRNRYHEKGAG